MLGENSSERKPEKMKELTKVERITLKEKYPRLIGFTKISFWGAIGCLFLALFFALTEGLWSKPLGEIMSSLEALLGLGFLALWILWLSASICLWYREDKKVLLNWFSLFLIWLPLSIFIAQAFGSELSNTLKERAFPLSFNSIKWFLLLLVWRVFILQITGGMVFYWALLDNGRLAKFWETCFGKTPLNILEEKIEKQVKKMRKSGWKWLQLAALAISLVWSVTDML